MAELMDKFHEIIETEIPENEFMRVVRCKDCKHRPVEKYGDIHEPVIGMNGWVYADFTCPYLCGDLCYSRMPGDNWFCNFGEKKG